MSFVGDPIVRQARPLGEGIPINQQSITVHAVSGLGVIAMDDIPRM